MQITSFKGELFEKLSQNMVKVRDHKKDSSPTITHTWESSLKSSAVQVNNKKESSAKGSPST